MQFKDAKFIKTAMKPADYPTLRDDGGNLLPEIALAGRSNVGKSSLLNHLFFRKNLVKTSSIPGKTQAINFFTVDEELTFVDLPGYGFAKVPLAVRREWGPMIQAYLENRETLKALLFLFDIRRLPNEEDFMLVEWANHQNIPLILVLTKVDKVNKTELAEQTKKITEAFGTNNYTHYSVVKNLGRKELLFQLKEVLKWDE